MVKNLIFYCMVWFYSPSLQETQRQYYINHQLDLIILPWQVRLFLYDRVKNELDIMVDSLNPSSRVSDCL